jgi:hypothetical protein
MESSSIGGQWSISPTSSLSGFLLAALILYLSFRHMLFTLMFMDIVIGWMRRFNWFPKEGKRLRTFVHNVIAWGVLLIFLMIAEPAGWLTIVPK